MGKTSTVAKLAGKGAFVLCVLGGASLLFLKRLLLSEMVIYLMNFNLHTELPATYSETPGIQTTLVYWPAKVVWSATR